MKQERSTPGYTKREATHARLSNASNAGMSAATKPSSTGSGAVGKDEKGWAQ